MSWIILLGVMLMGVKFESDHFVTKDGKDLEITFIKHASLMLNFDGYKIYVDPVSDYADYSQFPKADLILITHEHRDHFDPKAIALLETPNTCIVTNLAVQKKLGRGMMMKNGDELRPLEWIELQAVPAYNTTPGREVYHPRGRDNGFVLTLGGTRIYIAGDTEDIPEMQQLGPIDVAFLPVNQPYTMTVSQAARAARIIEPKILYPYHYGETSIELLKEELQPEKGIEVRVRQLQ